METNMKIFFDGGAKPNPGQCECGVIIAGPPIERFKNDIGYGTNNIAEWTALLWALGIALERGYKEIDIYGDSKLVVSQANGVWKIKQENFIPFKTECDRLRKLFVRADIHHLLRDKNLAGQFLEFG